MKSELAFYEIKNLLKKFEKQNRIKTVAMVGFGIAAIVIAAVVVIAKLSKKKCPKSYDGIDFEDWDDFEVPDYEDYDYDDAYAAGHVYMMPDEDEAGLEADNEE